MKNSVRIAFVAFTTPLEGCVYHLYADIKNLITVAIGCLVDSSPGPNPWLPATSLPFVRSDGLLASAADITAAWLAVKGDPKAAKYGYKYAEHIVGNNVRLTEAGVYEVVMRKLEQNDQYLSRRFPDWEAYPADAQLAVHAWAWACGPASRFPHLEDAIKRQDWLAARENCTINETGNPGLKPRNLAMRMLYENAARVQALHLDPDALIWPQALLPGDPA